MPKIYYYVSVVADEYCKTHNNSLPLAIFSEFNRIGKHISGLSSTTPGSL